MMPRHSRGLISVVLPDSMSNNTPAAAIFRVGDPLTPSSPINSSLGTDRGMVDDGSLWRLMDIPIDVLFEIFGHLHPLDLLHLARTAKRLRALLMRRSAVSVWKAALGNVKGLPRCPSDLTEPQFVNLAFDEHCHFCLAPQVQRIYWSCRVRCCDSCVDKHFISDFALRKRIPRATGEEDRYKTIFPYIVYPHPRPYQPGRIMYYLPVAEQYIRELAAMDEGIEGVIHVKQWSTQKKAEQNRRLLHAALCESWGGHWVSKRSRELNLLCVLVLIALLAFQWDRWKGPDGVR